MNELKPASFGLRLLANTIDLFFLLLLIGLFTAIFKNSYTNEFSNLLQFIYALFVPLLWYGYTIGKKSCKIQIVRLDNSRPTFKTMFLRGVVGNLVYLFPIFIGQFFSYFQTGSFSFNTANFDTIDPFELIFSFLPILIGSFFSILILFVSVLMVLIRKDKRSIHDMIAKTYVKKVD